MKTIRFEFEVSDKAKGEIEKNGVLTVDFDYKRLHPGVKSEYHYTGYTIHNPRIEIREIGGKDEA